MSHKGCPGYPYVTYERSGNRESGWCLRHEHLARVVEGDPQRDENRRDQVLIRALGKAGERVGGDHSDRVREGVIGYRRHRSGWHTLGQGRQLGEPIHRGDDGGSAQPPGQRRQRPESPGQAFELLAGERELLVVSCLGAAHRARG
jgi:hypothetical protein